MNVSIYGQQKQHPFLLFLGMVRKKIKPPNENFLNL